MARPEQSATSRARTRVRRPGHSQRHTRGARVREDHLLDERPVARIDTGLERGVPEDLVEIRAPYLIGVVGDPAARIGEVRVLGLVAVREAEIGAVLAHESGLLEALRHAQAPPERHRRGQQALSDGEARVARAVHQQHLVPRAPHQVGKRGAGGAAADHHGVILLAKGPRHGGHSSR